jgi:hypothetical protein
MTPQERLESRHRSAVLALMRAEKKLAAAFSRWAKLRDQVRRYDRQADKALASKIGGTLDVRELDKLMGGP